MVDRKALRLRIHQQENLDYFRSHARGLSLLPYGSGKGPVAIKRIGDLAPHMRCLVVTTQGTIYNWLTELKNWGDPKWSIRALIGTKEQRLNKFREMHNVAVINFEGLDVMLQALGSEFARAYGCVIIDEIHRAKGPDTDVSKNLAYLTNPEFAQYVYGLTGSPVLESLLDIFSILRIVNPSMFGSDFEAWRDRYFVKEAGENDEGDKTYPKWVPKPGAREFLSEKLHSISFYRDKSSVDVVYPSQIFDKPIYFELTGDARRQYDDVEQGLSLSLRHETISLVNIYPRLEKMCQLARGWVYDTEGRPVYYPEYMDAIATFTEMVEETRGRGRLCVWAVRPPEMAMIAHVLEQMGMKYRIIYGKLRSLKRREEITKLFNDGYLEVLIAQPRCMGEGLNLKADHSIRYSYRWSATEWSQPIGRFTRISSTASVVRYRDLVARNTIDEGILKSVGQKLDLGEVVKKYKALPWRKGPSADAAYAPSL